MPRMKTTVTHVLQALAVLSALVTPAACSRKIWIAQYPPFYTRRLKTVAVMPFDTKATRPQAGPLIAERIAKVLLANGTYSVISGQELQALLSAHKIQIQPDEDPRVTARKLAAAGNIQAVLVGKVRDLKTESKEVAVAAGGGSEEDRYGLESPRRAFGDEDERVVKTRSTTRNSGRITADVFFVGVGECSGIYAAMAGASAEFSSLADESGLNREECLQKAYGVLGAKLAARFAHVPRQIKISRRGSLATARKLPNGDLKLTGTFKRGEHLHVLVRLPEECDYNQLRVEIARPDKPLRLAAHTFTWSRRRPIYSCAFVLEPLARTLGPGEYVVNLYCLNKLAISRGFKISK